MERRGAVTEGSHVVERCLGRSSAQQFCSRARPLGAGVQIGFFTDEDSLVWAAGGDTDSV